MTRRQRRLTLIGGALGAVALAVALVLIGLKDSIVFFNSPTDLVEKHIAPGQRMRVGGLVKEGSLSRGDLDWLALIGIAAPPRVLARRLAPRRPRRTPVSQPCHLGHTDGNSGLGPCACTIVTSC